MSGSYRLGSTIVAASIAVAAVLLTPVYLRFRPAAGPAGQDLGDGYALGSYRLTERSGRTITEADLADDVWVASFIFTRCPLSCPKISAVVQGLQSGKLAGSPVRFVSVSVDPEYDTPPVLAAYAHARGADPDRWWFLTGPKDDVFRLILERFHLPVADNPEAAADPKVASEAVAHSDRLALVDRGNRVVGVFDSKDPDALAKLVATAKRLAGPAAGWVLRLPALNATLNGTCAILLILGWVAILTGRWRAHAACMIAGVIVSAVFLGSYLTYHYAVGSVPFRGTGLPQYTYLTILFSHTLLATFGVVPLVAATLVLAIRRRFDRHKRIARVTLPIWLYVSVTGVIIYWMLYRSGYG